MKKKRYYLACEGMIFYKKSQILKKIHFRFKLKFSDLSEKKNSKQNLILKIKKIY